MHRIIWSKYGFGNLLVWLFVYLMIGPFLTSMPYADTVLDVLFTLVICSAVFALSRDSRVLSTSIFFFVPIMILLWMNILDLLHFHAAVLDGLLVLFFCTLVSSFGRHLIAVRRVTANVIAAALCLYLIVGLLWGAVFAMTESLAPGSFAGKLLMDVSSIEEKAHFFNYFSFVTLTTLGYGDITPQTWGATALCQSEAIVGQFFMVVFVARLVAIQVSQRKLSEDGENRKM